MSEKKMSFEEFNKHIDEASDEECGMCFSFHHYSHLDLGTRKIAYLGFIESPYYYTALADELEKRESLPLDDNIYFMATSLEPMINLDEDLSTRIMIQVLRRANEMVTKDMANAWVAVRAYCWMKNNDPLLAYALLESTDDLAVWQVVFQTTPWDFVKREGFKSLSLSSMRNMAYLYTHKVLDMAEDVKPYVVAVNGVKALASLQDPRVIEMMQRLPRHSLDNIIKEDVDRQIAYLTKDGQEHFIPTLETLRSLCQNKL